MFLNLNTIDKDEIICYIFKYQCFIKRKKMKLTIETYKVKWQYKISSYTYEKNFETLEKAEHFINSDRDLESAINIKVYHVVTTEEEIQL